MVPTSAPPHTHPPAAARPSQFRGVSEPPSNLTFVAILSVSVLVVVAAMWYLAKHSVEPQPEATRSPDIALMSTLAGHTDSVCSVAFSPDGRTLASGSVDNTIKLWEVATGREVRTLAGDTKSVQCVAFSPDGRFLTTESSGNVKLWEVATGREVRTLNLGDFNDPFHGVPDANRLNSQPEEYQVSFALSPDGRSVASSETLDKSIKLWDVATGHEVRTLGVPSGVQFVESLAFSPDGSTLASGSGVGTVKLWKVLTGSEVLSLAGHAGSVRSVAFSPDGRTLASGSSDKTIRLWEVSTGNEVRTLTGHTDEVRCVTFSPDGHTLASGSNDKTIKLWRWQDRTAE